MSNVTTSLQNWKFAENHVQQNLVGGDFVGSHSVIICATAPRAKLLVGGGTPDLTDDIADSISSMGPNFAIPIGVIDSAAIQQDRQLAQIFEIGSNRSYLMSARTVTAMSINRVLYKGPSLLRTLYAYYPMDNQPDNIFRDSQKNNSYAGITMDNDFKRSLQEPKVAPGHNNFWINLASDLFSQPTGLVFFVKDNDQSDVGAVYLEECYVQNHQMSMSANSIVMAESVSIRCDRMLPIKVNVSTI